MNLPEQQENARPFISPFSVRHGFTLQWTRVDPRWKGVENLLTHLTGRDEEIIEAVAGCQVVTGAQLAKAFWESPGRAPERLRLLARHGALIQHRLERGKNASVIYTLGPLGARVLGEPYHIWWKGASPQRVMARLALAQLYFRLRKKGPARVLPAPEPFTGVIALEENEYPVIVLRGNVPDMQFVVAKRLFVVAEEESELLSVAPQIHCPVRYTTDERLFTKPLPELFLRYKNGRLEEEGT